MRRMILILTVLAFAAPVMAGVTITAVNEGIGITGDPNVGVVRIDYASDANVSAFALEIEFTAGATVNNVNDYHIGESNSSGKGFGIFLDRSNGIAISAAGDIVGYGKPIVHRSSPDGSGTGKGESKVLIEMGALYEEGNEPNLTGTLCKIRYNSCNDTNMTISLNATRGNIVLEDATSANTNLPITLADLPDSNEEGCGGPPPCTVPDVTGMLQAAAEAAIIAANLTVGDVTTQASAEPNTEVLSQDPVGTTSVVCGTDVNMVVSDYECYFGQADYSDWEAVGKPECWCYPKQCVGDADGLLEGNNLSGYASVSPLDLDVLIAGWMIKEPTAGTGIVGVLTPVTGVPAVCADFDHMLEGNNLSGYARVSPLDLDELILTWMIKEPTAGVGVPGDCLPGNEAP